MLQGPEGIAGIARLQSAAECAACDADIQALGEAFDAFVARTISQVAPVSRTLAKLRCAVARRQQPAWWDKDLADARRAAKRAARRGTSLPAARAARASYHRLLQRKRRQYLHNFAEDMTAIAKCNLDSAYKCQI